MPVSDSFVAFLLDQLEALGSVSARRMFGGVGLYAGDHFFAIVARDVLYLKVDASSRARFAQAGMRAFQPFPDRPGTMQYYEVPVAVLEDADELVVWARSAVAVAAGQAGRPGRPQAKKRR